MARLSWARHLSRDDAVAAPLTGSDSYHLSSRDYHDISPSSAWRLRDETWHEPWNCAMYSMLVPCCEEGHAPASSNARPRLVIIWDSLRKDGACNLRYK
jgi:hypothetical protein